MAPISSALGLCSARGTREYLCDATDHHVFVPTGTLAFAVVDGVHNSAEISDAAQHLAWIGAHVAARQVDPAWGIMAARTPIANDIDEQAVPDAAMAVAVALPDHVKVAWVGDVRAYGWDGSRLLRRTVDITDGNRRRLRGEPEADARRADRVIVTTVARATIDTVPVVSIPDDVVLVVSDGVSKVLTEQDIAVLIDKHLHGCGGPEATARAIVEATEDIAGTRDDASAALWVRPRPLAVA